MPLFSNTTILRIIIGPTAIVIYQLFPLAWTGQLLKLSKLARNADGRAVPDRNQTHDPTKQRRHPRHHRPADDLSPASTTVALL